MRLFHLGKQKYFTLKMTIKNSDGVKMVNEHMETDSVDSLVIRLESIITYLEGQYGSLEE